MLIIRQFLTESNIVVPTLTHFIHHIWLRVTFFFSSKLNGIIKGNPFWNHRGYQEGCIVKNEWHPRRILQSVYRSMAEKDVKVVYSRRWITFKRKPYCLLLGIEINCQWHQSLYFADIRRMNHRRGQPEGSLFNCYNTEERARLLSVDCSTLPLKRTL